MTDLLNLNEIEFNLFYNCYDKIKKLVISSYIKKKNLFIFLDKVIKINYLKKYVDYKIINVIFNLKTFDTELDFLFKNLLRFFLDNKKNEIILNDKSFDELFDKFIDDTYKIIDYDSIIDNITKVNYNSVLYNSKNRFYTQILKYNTQPKNINTEQLIKTIDNMFINNNITIDYFLNLKNNINFKYNKEKENLYRDKQYILIRRFLFFPVINKLINMLKDDLKNHVLVNELTNDSILLQKVEINTNSRTLFVGDFHSSFESLFNMIEHNKEMFINNNSETTFKLKDNCYIFFLGDIIDRGPFSVELLFFIMVIKIINFNNVYIIRGNHEDKAYYIDYGYGEEIEEQFYLHDEPNEFFSTQLFSLLPSCIYLHNGLIPRGKKNWIHLSHGAFNPKYIEDPTINIYLLNDNLKYYKLNDIVDDNTVDYFKLGDFYCTLKENINDENLANGRPMITYESTKDYCGNNNILCIISGHQDLKNLLILPNNNMKDKVNNDNNTPNFNIMKFNNNSYENLYFNDIYDLMDYIGIDITFDNLQNIDNILIRKNIKQKNDIPIIKKQQYDDKLKDDEYYEYIQNIYEDYIKTKDYQAYDLFELVNDNKDGKLKSYNLPEPGREFLALTTSTAKIARNMCCDCWIVMENDYV